MSKKKEAVLIAVKIRCPKLDKLITVPFKDVNWDARDSECELCGSHGGVTVIVRCKCGKSHNIDVYDW